MKRILALSLSAVLFVAVATRRYNPSAALAEDAPATAPAAGVESITLPVIAPSLPPGPGRETTLAACVICHSTSYITMQPPFPRKTWEAEVDKMRKAFGAPVTDAQAKEVVTYLLSIRGAAAPATRP